MCMGYGWATASYRGGNEHRRARSGDKLPSNAIEGLEMVLRDTGG